MKVTVYDEMGEVIGIALHENNCGYVELPPSTRSCVATHFTVNDGPKQELTTPVRTPVDAELRLRIRDLNARSTSLSDDYFSRIMREAFEKEVDNTAPSVTLWGKIKRLFGG